MLRGSVVLFDTGSFQFGIDQDDTCGGASGNVQFVDGKWLFVVVAPGCEQGLWDSQAVSVICACLKQESVDENTFWHGLKYTDLKNIPERV